MGQSAEREALSRCLGHRLQDIAGILDAASASGRLSPVGPIGNPPKRLWHLQAWDSPMAAQTATHFSKPEMLGLGGLDAYLRTIDTLNTEELGQWTTLWTIVGPGRRLAIGEEPQLRQALAHATYDAKLMRIAAHQMIDDVRGNELLSRDELATMMRKDNAVLKKMLPVNRVCQPIGPAPAHYGDSPFQMDLTVPYPANG